MGGVADLALILKLHELSFIFPPVSGLFYRQRDVLWVLR